MERLLWLLLAIGGAPLALGLVRSGRWQWPGWRWATVSLLLCTLAFNLTFVWQELWLVIPKALTPGLHPILYHNDHNWSGTAPIAELLQGSGALATLASGLVFAVALPKARAPTLRLFVFWMAFEGLFQSLTQLAIGTLLPGNDMGRALAYLAVPEGGKIALLVLAVLGMALAGVTLGRFWPRGSVSAFLVSALLSVVLLIPFRLPRDMIEVLLVPAFVQLVGAGWLLLGTSLTRGGAIPLRAVSLLWPALALGALLLAFQLLLRPGIAF